jgi:peptide deformylase
MILPIKKWPDPILLQVCRPWDFDDQPTHRLLQRFIEQDLIDTMVSENALGLAANQVGVGYRIVAMNVQAGEYAEQKIVLVNPIVSKQSDELWEATEGCLSFPRVELTIARSKYVFVHWTDVTGNLHSGIFSDIDAKCLLHEIDHLDGKVFKDYVSDLKFKTAVRKAKKK